MNKEQAMKRAQEISKVLEYRNLAVMTNGEDYNIVISQHHQREFRRKGWDIVCWYDEGEIRK